MNTEKEGGSAAKDREEDRVYTREGEIGIGGGEKQIEREDENWEEHGIPEKGTPGREEKTEQEECLNKKNGGRAPKRDGRRERWGAAQRIKGENATIKVTETGNPLED